jgi:hypothetical protein
MSSSEPERFGRWQSGALNAAGFFVLLYIVSSVMFLIPIVGTFFHAAMYAGLPVTLAVSLKGSQVSGLQLWAAMVMPYPAIGLALGLWRPLERPLFWRATVQMALRLAATMALLIVPGVLLFLSSRAH